MAAPPDRRRRVSAPVTANQASPPGAGTKTIGAKHRDSSVTVVSSSPSPVDVTLNGSVTMFAVVAVPFVDVRQLTIALNCEKGLGPWRLGGTGARCARTRPST